MLLGWDRYQGERAAAAESREPRWNTSGGTVGLEVVIWLRHPGIGSETMRHYWLRARICAQFASAGGVPAFRRLSIQSPDSY